MEVHPGVIVVVILLVIAYYGHTAGWFNNSVVVSTPAEPAKTPAEPAKLSGPSPAAGKYANLISVLKSKSDWLFFDDGSKTRQTMIISIDDSKLTISIKGSTVTKNLTYVPHPTATDALMAIDPADDTYKLILKYVNDKTIELEEQKSGKIGLQITLGA
jgi:hypothetical protein